MNLFSKLSVSGGSLLAAVLFSLSPGSAKCQDVPSDIKPDHWAYEAVSDLAKKGLIKGYPPDGRFLGGRTLTRYEMATILKRVLDRMDEILKNQPKGTVSQEDFDKLKSSLGEIQQMVTEFKTQLTVIGTDMTKVKDDLTALRAQVSDLSAKVDTFDTRLNSLSTKVDAATIRADQALTGIEQLKKATDAALAKKVDVNVGKLRISGVFSVWAGTAFGDSLGGNTPTNFSAVPPGRNFGGGVGDTFRLRRGNIALDGELNSRVNYHTMFNVAKTGTGGSSVLQDLWVGYQLSPNWRIEVGQQKTGLSEEGTRSSVNLLTIARAIMNEDLPATAGKVGNARDTGAVLRFQASRIRAFVGLWDDNGATQSVVDNNREKFLDGGIYINTLRHFTFGIWGGTNVGGTDRDEKRDRAGGTFLFQSGPHYFEIEGAYARDIAAISSMPGRNGSIAVGFNALYAYKISHRWQVVGRYDIWDPAQNDRGGSTTESGVMIPQGDHKLKEYTFGINYYLSDNGTKIQLNYIRDDVEKNGASFFGKSRNILLTNFHLVF